jgi:Flp pilus assembly protein TadD
MNRGRTAEAIPLFERAIALHPQGITAMENLGRALLQTGRVPEAIAQLRAAVGNPHHGPEPLVDLIEALARTGEAAEAEAIARSSRSRFPQDPRFDVLLANLLVRRGARAEAVAPMEHAVSLTGGRNPVMLDQLAYTLAATGRFEEAARALEAALALRPGPEREAGLRRRLESVRRREAPP